MRILALLITLALLTACTSVTLPPPAPTVTPTPLPYTLQSDIDAGLRFLEAQYNADYGLLQESPDIGAHRYFLANDALLAAYVFELYGKDELAGALRTTLARYAIEGNGFIEVAWGEVIPWPPKHFEDPGTVIWERGDDQIMTVRHDGPGYFLDWSGFSNLACMVVVNEYNKDNTAAAHWLYDLQRSTFDGHGWPDLAYHNRNGVYETIGLTWCVYAGALMGQVDERVLLAMLNQQNPQNGGFHTHYQPDQPQLADPNVETTALALLALHTLQHGPPQRVRLGFPAGSGPPSP